MTGSYYVAGAGGCVNLQATLSASSAGADDTVISPHHPILCTDQLEYHPDGRFSCPHAEVPENDPRTRDVLQHTIAILIMEMAAERFR